MRIENPVLSRFSPQNETHPFLQRFKKSWGKRFRHTRTEELFEGVDLAHYLTALEREGEARDLLHYLVDDQEFNGTYHTWTALGCGMTLLARLQRLAGEDVARRTQLQRLVGHNYRVAVVEGELEQLLEEHDAVVREALDDTLKWGAHALSRHLMSLNFFRETVDGAFPHAGTYPVEGLDAAIHEALRALRTKLGPPREGDDGPRQS